MLDYCIKLLSLFLYPFQDIFVNSEFGSVLLICIIFIPVILLSQLVKEITS